MSFRTFIRSIKDVKDDAELFGKVKDYDPTIKIKASAIQAQ